MNLYNFLEAGKKTSSATNHKQPERQKQTPAASSKPSKQSKQRPAKKIPEKQQTDTFLVSNLLDVDEDTLSYWVKSITGSWPVSIHMSDNQEKAIVKLSHGKIGKKMKFYIK